MIDSGQQLRALKVCSAEDIEKFGHWAKGSAMTEAYDNAAGVSELMARHVVLGAVRQGWRPVLEGELPNPLPQSMLGAQTPSLGSSSSSGLSTVGNRIKKKWHLANGGEKFSRCRMFAFDEHTEVPPDVVLGECVEGWQWCKSKACSRGSLG